MPHSEAMTDTPPPEGIPQRFEFTATPEVEAGTYANFVSVWNLPDCFVLDFSVFTQPPRLVEDDEGRTFAHMPARVVSRVRIPPEQVFELMKALNLQLTTWEAQTGKVRPDPDL